MCDLATSLNIPSTAFDEMPLSIESDDPLYNVGSKELASAMRTPSEHSWVAEWLFTNSAQPFHPTASTLPPEAFANSLAMHLHHDISSTNLCPTDIGYIPTTSTLVEQRPPRKSARYVHTKDLDLLMVPVAKVSQITVGYAFVRGIQNTPMHAMYSELIQKNPPTDSTSPTFDPNISTARFCFHHARTDYTMVISGIGGRLMGIVSMRWVSPTSRERSFIIVPNSSYGPRRLPSRVLSVQCHTDYRVPVPEEEIAPLFSSNLYKTDQEPTNTGVFISDSSGDLPMGLATGSFSSKKATTNGRLTGAKENAVHTNNKEEWSLSNNQNVSILGDANALGATGTLVSPSASGEITLDAAQDYLLNYIDTELYDQVLNDPTYTPVVSGAQSIRPLSEGATLDEILSVASSLATSSGVVPGSRTRSTSSGSSGNDSSLSNSSMLPAFELPSDDFLMDVVEHLDEREELPDVAGTSEWDRGVFPTSSTAGLGLSTRTDMNGLWLLSSGDGTTPDGVGVPRSPGRNDTSSGAFDMGELQDALGSIELSFKGVYFSPRVRKDIMHPRTGELLSRSTGEVSAKLFRPDDVTVSMLRHIAAQSYYSNFLSVSSDTRLVAAATTRLSSQSFNPTLVHQQNQLQHKQQQQEFYQANHQNQTRPDSRLFTSSLQVAPYPFTATSQSPIASPFAPGVQMGTTSQQAPSTSQPPLQPRPQSRIPNGTTFPSGPPGPTLPSSRRKSTPRKAPSPSPAPLTSTPSVVSDKTNGSDIEASPAMLLSKSAPVRNLSTQKLSQALAFPDTGAKLVLPVPAARQTTSFKRQAAAPLAPRPVVTLLSMGPVSSVGAATDVAASSGISNVSGIQTTSSPMEVSVGVGDNTRESKLEAKRIRNRLSAAKSNQKRREHLEAQKKELSQLKARVEQLRSRETHIERENEYLRKQIAADNRHALSR